MIVNVNQILKIIRLLNVVTFPPSASFPLAFLEISQIFIAGIQNQVLVVHASVFSASIFPRIEAVKQKNFCGLNGWNKIYFLIKREPSGVKSPSIENNVLESLRASLREEVTSEIKDGVTEGAPQNVVT